MDGRFRLGKHRSGWDYTSFLAVTFTEMVTLQFSKDCSKDTSVTKYKVDASLQRGRFSYYENTNNDLALRGGGKHVFNGIANLNKLTVTSH